MITKAMISPNPEITHWVTAGFDRKLEPGSVKSVGSNGSCIRRGSVSLLKGGRSDSGAISSFYQVPVKKGYSRS